MQLYQVGLNDATTGNSQLPGIYDIPASTTNITLAGHRITDANLSAQYTFASKAEVDALMTIGLNYAVGPGGSHYQFDPAKAFAGLILRQDTPSPSFWRQSASGAALNQFTIDAQGLAVRGLGGGFASNDATRLNLLTGSSSGATLMIADGDAALEVRNYVDGATRARIEKNGLCIGGASNLSGFSNSKVLTITGQPIGVIELSGSAGSDANVGFLDFRNEAGQARPGYNCR